MSQIRKMVRAQKGSVLDKQVQPGVARWARNAYLAKYGLRAAEMAVVCRMNGLRDLVIPVADVPTCIPTLASRARPTPNCQHGGMYERGGNLSECCREKAALLLITDSGLELFICEEHAEKRVVRVPV